MIYVFDTDHLSLNQRFDPSVTARLTSFDYTKHQLLTTVISHQEPWQLLDYDDRADRHFQSARKSGMRIGTMDLRIASICIAHSATLVTRNRKDFQPVPNLKFEDWSV